jgi:bacteriocin biosynthesis cyclodehydratase domain-containing protein
MAVSPVHPLLSPWHQLVIDESRILVEYGGEAAVFEGRAAQTLLPVLLPLLDGRTTVDDIVGALGSETRPAVEHALTLLVEHGLLTEGPPLSALPRPLESAALFHAANDPVPASPAQIQTALRAASVSVVGASHTAAESARALRLSGVGCVDRIDWEARQRADVTVVAPTRAELDRLAAWNEHALATGAQWLQILPFNGTFAAIGPLYVPRETCCYECYRARRAANVDYPDLFWAFEQSPQGAEDAPAIALATAGVATTAVLRWLLARDAFVAGTMLALELRQTVVITEHVVYRIPRCPSCADVRRIARPLPWAEAS